jgi:hypothetical protein
MLHPQAPLQEPERSSPKINLTLFQSGLTLFHPECALHTPERTSSSLQRPSPKVQMVLLNPYMTMF